MPQLIDHAELEAARDFLWSSDEESSEEFTNAVAVLRTGVEAGALEYAGLLAEVLAFPGPHHDAPLAYKCYYVSFAAESFSVQWANESSDPLHYQGPIGDFRNEAMVSDLVHELGLAALPALDADAARLLASGI